MNAPGQESVFTVGRSTFRIRLGAGARQIVVLPNEHAADPEVLDADEDLLLVFRTETGWLLVCETSVRLIVDGEETSRIEVGDVIERARWSKGRVLVEDASGMTTTINVTGSRLSC